MLAQTAPPSQLTHSGHQLANGPKLTQQPSKQAPTKVRTPSQRYARIYSDPSEIYIFSVVARTTAAGALLPVASQVLETSNRTVQPTRSTRSLSVSSMPNAVPAESTIITLSVTSQTLVTSGRPTPPPRPPRTSSAVMLAHLPAEAAIVNSAQTAFSNLPQIIASPPAPLPNPVQSSNTTSFAQDQRQQVSNTGFTFNEEELKAQIKGSISSHESQQRLEQILDYLCLLGNIHPKQKFAINETNVVVARTWLLKIVSYLFTEGGFSRICRLALTHFIEVCHNDPLTKESADQLYTHAEKILILLSEANKQVPRMQKKISSACQALMELILRHYTFDDNLNAIPGTLKKRLKDASNELSKANKKKSNYHNLILDAEISYNQQTILRVRDDKQMASDFFQRFICLAKAVMYAYKVDPEAITKLFETFKDIDFAKSWFEMISALRISARIARYDLDALQKLITVIDNNANKASWRFLLFALKELGNITVAGVTLEIRFAAYVTLLKYMHFSDRTKSKNLSPHTVVSTVNPNPAIQEQVIRSLFKIFRYCTDKSLVSSVSRTLTHFLVNAAPSNFIKKIREKMSSLTPSLNESAITPLANAVTPAPANTESLIFNILVSCFGISSTQGRNFSGNNIESSIQFIAPKNLLITDLGIMKAFDQVIQENKTITKFDCSAFNTPGSEFNGNIWRLATAIRESNITFLTISGVFCDDESHSRRVADHLVTMLAPKLRNNQITISCDTAITYANIAGALFRMPVHDNSFLKTIIHYIDLCLSCNPSKITKSRATYVKACAYYEGKNFTKAAELIKIALDLSTEEKDYNEAWIVSLQNALHESIQKANRESENEEDKQITVDYNLSAI